MKVEGGYLYNVIVMDVGRVGPCEVLKLRNVRPGSEMKRPSDEAARRSAVIDKVKSLIDGLKPAKNYIANTVQASHGHFHAIWASPGLKPDFVYDGCGSALFDDVKSAEAKAGEVLFDALNNDLRLKKQSKRRRLAPGDLGETVVCSYYVDDGVLWLCDEHGKGDDKPHVLAAGDDPRRVASRLRREAWQSENGRSAFNRPLHQSTAPYGGY